MLNITCIKNKIQYKTAANQNIHRGKYLHKNNKKNIFIRFMSIKTAVMIIKNLTILVSKNFNDILSFVSD